MPQLILLYTKKNIIVLLSCLFAVLLNLLGIASFETITFFVLVFFLYELNIVEKVNRNWAYLETLPVSIFQRYLLRVIIPFLLFIVVSTGVSDNYYFLPLIKDHTLSAASIILASVLASGLGKFILYYFAISIIGFFTVRTPFIGAAGSVVLALGMSFYVLSNKRIDFKKVAVVLAIIIIPLSMILRVSQTSFYRYLFNNGDFRHKLYAAEILADNHDPVALYYLKSTIKELDNARDINIVLDILERNEYSSELTKNEWLDVFDSYYSSRSKILSYFSDKDTVPKWISHKELKEFERVIFKESTTCASNCRALAKVVRKRSSVNLDRIVALVNSNERVKMEYALELMRGTTNPTLKGVLKGLTDHPNDYIKKKALRILEYNEMPRIEIETSDKGLSDNIRVILDKKTEIFIKSKRK